MSRALSPLFLAAFLLLGSSAPACPTCDLPSASAPVSDPPPQAVFEAAAPGALLPEERAWLLALEDGRYTLASGRLSDGKTAPADKHLLSNESVWKLLGRRASQRVAALRPLAKDGRLPEEVRGEAVALFWLRGSLLDADENAFLREATRPKDKRSSETGGFGTTSSDGSPSVAAGPLAQPSSASQNAALLKALRASLVITPGSDPRAAAAMDEALVSLLSTPTGRELALEFTASGSKAKLEFGDVANSSTVVMNGRRILRSSGGHTHTSEDPPRVVLNKDYLDTDPDFRRVNMTATLGHELFGHGFEEQRSKKAGISHKTLYHYRGDEAGSGLIGWLVQTELGGRLDNGHMWTYLKDPEQYHADLKTNLPYYSTTLSTTEMRDPVATLEKRVTLIEPERKKARDYAAAMVAWRPIIEHFITTHGMDRAKFSARVDDISAAEIWSAGRLKSLDAIAAQLTGTIKQWKEPGAAALKKDLAAASNSTYMTQAEGRLVARADRLRGLVAGRSQEPTVPPVPGKLTWDDLNTMLAKDRKDNPGHLEKK